MRRRAGGLHRLVHRRRGRPRPYDHPGAALDVALVQLPNAGETSPHGEIRLDLTEKLDGNLRRRLHLQPCTELLGVSPDRMYAQAELPRRSP